MTTRLRTPLAAAVLIVAFAAPTIATKSIDLDAATIADLNAAFDAGTLTAEALVQLCLARIQAYDRQGPSLHAVITLNPKALETAPEVGPRRLDDMKANFMSNAAHELRAPLSSIRAFSSYAIKRESARASLPSLRSNSLRNAVRTLK